MREILFRGKRTDDGEWVYGNYVHTDCFTQYNDYIGQNVPLDWPVDPSTVGQYTGLKDKKGKRIFEGDIVEFQCARDPEDRICTVTWDDETARFGLYNPLFVGDFLRYDSKDIVVIGNIHDNPDLLEVE